MKQYTKVYCHHGYVVYCSMHIVYFFIMSLSALLIRRSRFLVVGGLLCALLSVAVSFLFPLQYRADAQILILPRVQYGTDPFSATKAAEQVAENLSSVVTTDEFRSLVVNALPSELQGSFTRSTPKKTRSYWNKTVETSPVFGTNFLSVSAYSTDKQIANQIVSVVAQILLERGQEYTPSPIMPRIINNPIVSDYPARPNLPMNAGLGFVVGVLITAFLITRREYQT